MLTVKILAGDIIQGTASYKAGHVKGFQLLTVSIATEESMKKVGGILVGGLTGGLLFGPLGAIGGMLAKSGDKKKIVFVAEFSGGKRALISADSEVFTKIQADIFNGPISTSQYKKMEKEEPYMAFGAFIGGGVGLWVLHGIFDWNFLGAAIVSVIPAMIGALLSLFMVDSDK